MQQVADWLEKLGISIISLFLKSHLGEALDQR